MPACRQAGSVGANKSPCIPLYERGKGRGILKARLSRLSGDRKHCPTKQIPIVVSEFTLKWQSKLCDY